MNLVDLLKGQLTAPGVLSKLGSAVGLEGDAAGKGLGAALPALLGVISSVAGTPEGARKLDDAVDKADDGILGNLGNALSGGSVSSLLNGGSGVLSSLLGGGMLGGVVSAIVRFTGLGNGAVSGLLGLLTPIVLGALKGQKKSLGLDAGGLASMLAGQKSNIAAALPAGLGSLLGSVPGLSSFADAGQAAPRAAASVSTPAPSTYRAPAAEAASASPMRWLLPLLLLAGLGLLLWSLLGRGGDGDTPRADPRSSPGQVTPGAIAAPAIAGASEMIGSFFTDAKALATSITDEASATAAIPKLTAMAGNVGGIKKALDAIPATEGSRVSLIEKVRESSNELLPLLDAAAQKFPALKPAVDQLKSGVASLTA